MTLTGVARPLLRSVEAADQDLLRVKLVPPRVPPSYVPRPRVDELLTAGARGPLTTVVAGAGWGKTLAAAGWAASGRPEGPVAWVSLDRSEDDPGTFWAYVAAAVRAATALTPDNPLTHLSPGLGTGEERVRRLASGLAELPRPLVIVLDDVHLLEHPQLLAELSELLHMRISAARFVLLGRTGPALPVHRLRMSGDLAEVRTDDLSFSVPEAGAMLGAHLSSVDAEGTRRLVRRTEGWAAGLRLAAFVLGRDHDGPTAWELGGADAAVTEYLTAEVLATLEPETLRFLTRTAVPERLTGELAEVLSDQDQGQRRLESLAGSNSFVVGLGTRREWFRYHALMREALVHRLEVEEPDLLRDLHRKASRWFADNGDPLAALEHAVASADWTLVGQVFVTQASPLLVSAERTSLDRVLAGIPAHRLASDPALSLCAAARAFHAGQFAEMTPYVERAAQLTDGDDLASRTTRVVVHLLSMAVARAHGDVASLVENAEAALEDLTRSGLPRPSADAFRTVALGNLGAGQLWAGRLREAEGYLLRGLEMPAEIGVELARINMMGHLALIAVLSGRLEEGRDRATRAVSLIEERGWASLAQAATAYLALGVAATERLEHDEALRWLGRGSASAVAEPSPRLAFALATVEAHTAAGRLSAGREAMARLVEDRAGRALPPLLERWMGIAQAELDLASGEPQAVSGRISPAGDHEPPFAREQVCLARAALDSHDPERAEDVLTPLRDLAEVGHGVEVWLATALSADRRHQDERALRALETAVRLAAPGDVRRPFATWSPEVTRRLLTRSCRVGSASAGLSERLLRDLGHPEDDESASSPVEQLTERELGILRLLPTMMTNAEIAAELYVSSNTVKAHLKSVYRKLGVTTRREAVQRASERGLLSG